MTWRETEETMVAISPAAVEDAEEILALQKLAYQSEAALYGGYPIPPLTQTLEELIAEFRDHVVLKAEEEGRIVGSVRAQQKDGVCQVGRLIVNPDSRRRGIGGRLLEEIEKHFPSVGRFELFTGSMSADNIRLYQRHGYAVTHVKKLLPTIEFTFLAKPDQGKHAEAEQPKAPRGGA